MMRGVGSALFAHLLVAASVEGIQCPCGPHTFTSNASGLFCPLVTEEGAALDPSNPRQEYPRPQMVRKQWTNLNGIWEFTAAGGQGAEVPELPANFSKTIVVPFPPEACLSGVWVTGYGDDAIPKGNNSWNFRLWYKRYFDAPTETGATYLHFGASDWQTTVFLNQKRVGDNTGGYNSFSFDITHYLREGKNELAVFVYDPSDFGDNQNGKQRLSAILEPSGDTYSPTSGIWQTVWLETVPRTHVFDMQIETDLETLNLTLQGSSSEEVTYSLEVSERSSGKPVLTANGTINATSVIPIPSPMLWTPDEPNLYTMTIKYGDDEFTSYFGLRTFALGTDRYNVTRPALNGKFIFLNGMLDQSYWPDGLYSHPSDEALEKDMKTVKSLGFNLLRVHQKVNPETYYYYADTLGIVLFQDAAQKFKTPYNTTSVRTLFEEDLKHMIYGKRNHPSIVQWTIFNEEDMTPLYSEGPRILSYARSLDSTRLFDMDSGGSLNNKHLADVNDVHTYPNPTPVLPSATQYAMTGEWGGFGLYLSEHEWIPKKCSSYVQVKNSQHFLESYEEQVQTLIKMSQKSSVSVLTQVTDTERECDGILTYDRIMKLTEHDVQNFTALNTELCQVLDKLN